MPGLELWDHTIWVCMWLQLGFSHHGTMKDLFCSSIRLPSHDKLFIIIKPDRRQIATNPDMKDDHILSWLAKIATAASPSMSDDSNTDRTDDNVPTKRQRLDPNATHQEADRAYRLAGSVDLPPDDADFDQIPDDNSIVTATAKFKLACSRKSCSIKGMVSLERDSIVEMRILNGLKPVAPELLPIALRLQQIGQGRGIISSEDKVRLETGVYAMLSPLCHKQTRLHPRSKLLLMQVVLPTLFYMQGY